MPNIATSTPRQKIRRGAALMASIFLSVFFSASLSAQTETAAPAAATLKKYCFQCHSKAAAMGGISLDKLTAEPTFGSAFQQWRKVVHAVEHGQMPPAAMPQPSAEERQQITRWVRSELNSYAQKHKGDPGDVPLRRLTSGEFGYTIYDLTGLDFDVEHDFVADSVGGEGFTNYGDAQFVDDATLERYLEAAKKVAAHAVIGAGPITFFHDPGKSGLELSAVSRIQEIYTRNGFRASAGEGGLPYGLEKYTKAFYIAWRYKHRKALGEGKATLAQLAARESISPRFAEHVWGVLNQSSHPYPLSEVVARWKAMPVPGSKAGRNIEEKARAQAEEAKQYLVSWPRWLFAAGEQANGGAGDERALLLTDASVEAATVQKMRFQQRLRKGSKGQGHLWVAAANPAARSNPVVVWQNPTVKFRARDKGPAAEHPLKELLSAEDAAKFNFGKHPEGKTIGDNDFVTRGDTRITFEINVPDGVGGFGLEIDAAVDPVEAGDSILRATISESEDLAKGRPAWGLLANPDDAGFKAWKTGVLHFATVFPQLSHGEPTPSDKDDIPAPFDNTYNQPERDYFHYKVKYYRLDDFLVDKILSDEDRKTLDYAWLDLRGSFEYHDAFLRFVADKYKLQLSDEDIQDLKLEEIEALPAEARQYVKALRQDYEMVQAALAAAQPGHVEDCIEFAGHAWRRPLTAAEKDQLRGFYVNAREKLELDHAKAVRALLARILVAPDFLYRLEKPAEISGASPVSGWEMANRLSYFLWSTAPDKELQRAAAAGELQDPAKIEAQARRMLADPKAKRLATEFFGQWLGFYRFDQHRGVDAGRFPEFTEKVRSAMYEESVAFFDHIIREKRPVKEILTADYTFVNRDLAKHYGIGKEVTSQDPVKVEGLKDRGGILRMGSVLTVNSAPLRTSPVKRGDWILRRVLGTPTPPPPPDAGSIPADDKAFGGMTVKARLEVHRRNATCAGCHNRIDPLGFALENYDPVGRWRDFYGEDQPIENTGTLADKTEIAGIEGLQSYLQHHERQVMENMSGKLLGYALGRTVQASDQPLIQEMTAKGGNATMADLVSKVVTSPQFRNRRGREDAAEPRTISQTKPARKESGREAE